MSSFFLKNCFCNSPKVEKFHLWNLSSSSRTWEEQSNQIQPDLKWFQCKRATKVNRQHFAKYNIFKIFESNLRFCCFSQWFPTFFNFIPFLPTRRWPSIFSHDFVFGYCFLMNQRALEIVVWGFLKVFEITSKLRTFYFAIRIEHFREPN